MTFIRVILQFIFGHKNYSNGTKTPWQTMAMIDGFIPGWGTTRTCLDCGRIVTGGPTRCTRCANAMKGGEE